VDDAPVSIKRLQRFDGAPVEAELAVVVVFDDGGVVPLGPRQQRQPSRQRHGCAEGKLMRWHHVYKTRVPRHRIDHQSVTVHRHALHSKPQRLEHKPRRRIPGILDGHLITRRQQDPCNDIEGLLGAVRDDDIVRRGLHAAGDADVSSDGFPKASVARGVRVDPSTKGIGAQVARHQPPPCLVREERGAGNTAAEVELG
jgi:hypothetical protein